MVRGLRRWQTRQHRFENPDPLVGFVHLRGLNVLRHDDEICPTSNSSPGDHREPIRRGGTLFPWLVYFASPNYSEALAWP